MTTDSIVARAGANIPAPLAIPAKSIPLTVFVAILGTLSVVIIACAADSRDSLDILCAIETRPVSILDMGNNSPINPVEHTTTSLAETLRSSATFSAV